ncbi:MAG: hypothetical protein LC790_12950, partial [Actinobacteria bacterium]|nr:hypothetical protein [Actinomycetota bacterium]
MQTPQRAQQPAPHAASATPLGARAEQHRDAIDQAEQIAGLGTWEWTPDSGELWWSENLFRLFGLAPGEIA